MRETRLSGLEGGVAYRAIPTPIPTQNRAPVFAGFCRFSGAEADGNDGRDGMKRTDFPYRWIQVAAEGVFDPAERVEKTE